MNNLDEVADVYRSNVSRRRIFSKNVKIKQSLKRQANDICRGRLHEQKISIAFRQFNSGYVYYDRDDNELISIALWKVDMT